MSFFEVDWFPRFTWLGFTFVSFMFGTAYACGFDKYIDYSEEELHRKKTNNPFLPVISIILGGIYLSAMFESIWCDAFIIFSAFLLTLRTHSKRVLVLLLCSFLTAYLALSFFGQLFSSARVMIFGAISIGIAIGLISRLYLKFRLRREKMESSKR